MSETPSIPPLQMLLLRREWPPGDGLTPDAAWAWARRVYNGRPTWEAEFAMDLATLRPRRNGGLPSAAAGIDRSAMRKWRSGEKTLPPWLVAGLLRLPEVAQARRRKEIEVMQRELRDLVNDVGDDRDRARALLTEQYEALVPSVYRDPTLKPPPARGRSRRQGHPEVSVEEVEAAQGSGWSAARADMGVIDASEAAANARPDHPSLADAWDRGWVEAYRDEVKHTKSALAELEAGTKKATAGKRSPKGRK